MRTNNEVLFCLRVKVSDGSTVVVRAWESTDIATYSPTHIRLDVEVKQHGAIVFPRGQLWCGIPKYHSIDGVYARECVLSLVAMRAGDTDADYFTGYTAAQRGWADRYGEEIGMVREQRYCTDDGSCRV